MVVVMAAGPELAKVMVMGGVEGGWGEGGGGGGEDGGGMVECSPNPRPVRSGGGQEEGMDECTPNP